MKVLVTGGTGYLGRASVRAFQARGHELIHELLAQPLDVHGAPGGRVKFSRGSRRVVDPIDLVVTPKALAMIAVDTGVLAVGE